MTSTIHVENFSKSFGAKTVVAQLSFDVHEGEIFAFLGANGSGKTTTIRCLLNILQPTGGELLIHGKRYDTSMARMLGYLPEERGLYLDSNVLEVMVYFGELRGMSREDATRGALSYLERVGLADKPKAKIKTLSSGQQQKIQLGITILHRPKLLILDEPTKGLDPLNRTLLMDILKELQQKGATIVFITHQMEEVEKIANRLVMIKNGRRVLYGGVTEVKESFGDHRVRVDFTGPLPVHLELYSAVSEQNTADLLLNEGISPQKVLAALVHDNLALTRFELVLPSLNEIFVRIEQQS